MENENRLSLALHPIREVNKMFSFEQRLAQYSVELSDKYFGFQISPT